MSRSSVQGAPDNSPDSVARSDKNLPSFRDNPRDEGRFRGRREAGFAAVPISVQRDTRLSRGCRFLYGLLRGYAWQDDSTFPGQGRLAKDCGCSERQVQRWLDELYEARLLTVKSVPCSNGRAGRHNEYWFEPLADRYPPKPTLVSLPSTKPMSGPDTTSVSGPEATPMSPNIETLDEDSENEDSENKNKKTYLGTPHPGKTTQVAEREPKASSSMTKEQKPTTTKPGPSAQDSPDASSASVEPGLVGASVGARESSSVGADPEAKGAPRGGAQVGHGQGDDLDDGWWDDDDEAKSPAVWRAPEEGDLPLVEQSHLFDFEFVDVPGEIDDLALQLDEHEWEQDWEPADVAPVLVEPDEPSDPPEAVYDRAMALESLDEEVSC